MSGGAKVGEAVQIVGQVIAYDPSVDLYLVQLVQKEDYPTWRPKEEATCAGWRRLWLKAAEIRAPFDAPAAARN